MLGLIGRFSQQRAVATSSLRHVINGRRQYHSSTDAGIGGAPDNICVLIDGPWLLHRIHRSQRLLLSKAGEAAAPVDPHRLSADFARNVQGLLGSVPGPLRYAAVVLDGDAALPAATPLTVGTDTAWGSSTANGVRTSLLNGNGVDNAFPPYKKRLTPTPNDLVACLPYVVEAAAALHLPVLQVPHYAADHVLASYASATPAWLQLLVASNNKFLKQIVSSNVNLYTSPGVKRRWKLLDANEVSAEFGGILPQNIPDFLALKGDRAYSIPGIEGLDDSAISDLLTRYGGLSTLLQQIESVPGDAKEVLKAYRAESLRTLRSVHLRGDLPLPLPFSSLRYDVASSISTEHNKDLMEYLEMADAEAAEIDHLIEAAVATKTKSTRAAVVPSHMGVIGTPRTDDDLARMLGPAASAEVTVIDSAVKLSQWLQRAKRMGTASVFMQWNTPAGTKRSADACQHDPSLEKLVGVGLALPDGRCAYVSLGHMAHVSPAQSQETHDDDNGATDDDASSRLLVDDSERTSMVSILKSFFEDGAVRKVGHDVKADLKNCLDRVHHDWRNYDDVMVMAYCLYCGLHGFAFDEMLTNILPEVEIPPPIRELVGIGKKRIAFTDIDPALAAHFVGFRALCIQQMHDILTQNIRLDQRRQQLYQNIELPLVETLCSVERNGLLLDVDELERMSTDFNERLSSVESDIYEMAGGEFNINSSKQLGDIMFETLRCGEGHEELVKRSSKTGCYNTSAEVLQQLSARGAKFADLILDHRALSKLHSTYIVGLQRMMDPETRRVHTTFQNALTTTGRLSSVNPNLQNIPIRTEDGRMIRRAFRSPPGHTLLAVDYSQVELRILAHIASIDVLKDAFRDGRDVHAITASQVFQVPIDGMDPSLRRKAKAINFGIIYGMSKFGLSKRLDVTVDEADQYIRSYFKQYPGIKQYMERTWDFCRRNNFVETQFGRKCYIPDINSTSGAKRSFAERTAINTPIQGTSADITKIAMVRIGKLLRDQGWKSRMVLQVHDELIFEVPEEEREEISEVIRVTMERVGDDINFSVPLTVGIEYADRWGELH